ncbi:acyl-CoA thioesterase [Desulforhopalus singaporensis]|uniref:Acyl-CoA thioester hydrolase n=1 Tax=Desulforhopalus singaporensis TaxID=91360 RepID=A0A1H0T649_9BACT|nr:acyl-CoA thioesterase [Desulforhopalus singaporensis]SDP49230.1 acyl-CoA thioester hydrolase [Desulforhopalus singaporensis]
MGARNEYFPPDLLAPEPLTVTCERRVRFEEVDGLGMVWHGRYPSYLEDGRIAFGDAYGLTYQSFMVNNTVAPIVKMHIDYRRVLRFDEMVRIETSLHWSDAARLNFSYVIYNHEDRQAATGYTVQLMTEPDGTMLLVVPEWLESFRRKWRSGGWGS